MRRLLVFASTGLAAAALAAPVHADPPTITRDVPIRNVVSDADACGDFGLRWNIEIAATIVDFFDSEGRLVRRVLHIKEDNTITKLDLAGNPIEGTTLREGPDSFTQTVYFNADGTIDRIVATGLAARVGNELKDVGRVILVPIGGGRFDLAFAAGPHPLREAADDGRIVADALPAFCAVYE